MAFPSRTFIAPTPAPTPPPPIPPPSVSKRKRHLDRRSTSDRVDRRSSSFIALRDVIADEAQVNNAEQQCEVFSGNAVFSCYPTADTVIAQHEISSFVWNSNLPQFLQTNLVNVYLFDATNVLVNSWLGQSNPRGRSGVIRFPVNDTWWGDRGAQWNGKNQTFLFYWMVTSNTKAITDGLPQPIFTAVQTTFADSVAASMSSSSAAAASSAASLSSAVAASLSSASASRASVSASVPTSGSTDGHPNVQSQSSSSFPHWAIAVIVILGVLALLATGILIFFILRRVRNRRNSGLSHRGSMGSAAPMMANAQPGGAPHSPLLGAAALAGGLSAAGSHRPTSPDIHDGASTMSGSDAAPFSGADAAVMADAFRTALRKPNFADRPLEEGESPDDVPGQEGSDEGPGPLSEFMLTRHLAEEGRDIRSVSSSRGVKVETLSDTNDGDTISSRRR